MTYLQKLVLRWLLRQILRGHYQFNKLVEIQRELIEATNERFNDTQPTTTGFVRESLDRAVETYAPTRPIIHQETQHVCP